MTDYSASFCRLSRPFSAFETRAVLKALAGLNLGFFPARIWVSHNEFVDLEGPDDYSRSLVPDEFFIDSEKGVARIPFESTGGLQFVFSESADPSVMPACFVIEFSSEIYQEHAWNSESIIRMFRAVVEAFTPDEACVYDEEHRARPRYDDIMFSFDSREVPLGVFWLNYFGPRLVSNIGARRLSRLRDHVPWYETDASRGVLFCIMEEPYDEENPDHRAAQILLEQILDLEDLHLAFRR